MVIFKAIVSFAASKGYIAPGQRFDAMPKLKHVRRDAFTLDEYRHLLAVGKSWVASALRPAAARSRAVAYNFILVMTNTGMRPCEARNLRWRDVTAAMDRHGRPLTVLSVQGKDKARQLVAPISVKKYLARIRAIARATGPDDPVFTNDSGEPASELYAHLIADLLKKAELRVGPSGAVRSAYCFRHTYATFRLSAGIDAYCLAVQMGTSIETIERYYGHVDRVRHAHLLLQGMAGLDPDETDEAA